MNIFFLDHDIQLAARYAVDKHTVKMPLEYAQLLSTAHHEHNSPLATQVYKVSHKNHPCAVWTRSCKEAYDMVYELFVATSAEYAHRYGKVHKSFRELGDILANNPCPDAPLSKPPQCMPDEYKADDVVEAYRNYYRGDKRAMASWTKRFIPEWWK